MSWIRSSIRSWLCVLLVGTLLSSTVAWAQSAAREPRIGYLYPAGGQRGTVLRVAAGGQYLRGARKVCVTGKGVRARVVTYMRPFRNLNKDQRDLLRKRVREVAGKRLAELRGEDPEEVATEPGPVSKEAGRKKKTGDKTGSKKAGARKPVTLPRHPLLVDLDKKSLRELIHMVTVLQTGRGKRQLNRQLAECVLLEVTIDANAPPGDRELRIVTAQGLTSPVVFQVGSFREAYELEPNDRRAYSQPRNLPGLPRLGDLPVPAPLESPVVLNGQIMPGDVDRFRFRGKKGQALVIEARARRLIPYLADAVPGWFQATLTLYDARGRELAFADDYRMHPDPVMFCRIPEDGAYELEIRDAIYRGRADFVYRVVLGEQPFITRVFPLGGKRGVPTVAEIKGWNLPAVRLPLDTRAGPASIRRTNCSRRGARSNEVTYAVDTLPECREAAEAIDDRNTAQPVTPPVIVNGRIGKPGDVDVFRFRGRKGEIIVAEVEARRLDSPLDSLLRVTDSSGRVLAWNDDHVTKDGHLHKDRLGLTTHHADSYVRVELPRDGTYRVHVSDAQHHGSDAHGYRLRITPPRRDFALRMTPSSLTLLGGACVSITVHALRQDGFDGEIEIVVKDPPDFELTGRWIPAGCDHVRMTLRAPRKVSGSPVALTLEGRAWIDGEMVIHRVVPAEDVMQAFLYRHLVPSQELRCAVRSVRWRVPRLAVAGRPVLVPAGGNARVRIRGWRGRARGSVKLALKDPPARVTLADVRALPRALSFRVKLGDGAPPVGFVTNLIVEAFTVTRPKAAAGKPTRRARRVSLGVLPAIPIEIVARGP